MNSWKCYAAAGIFVAVVALLCNADVSHVVPKSSALPVTEICLGCMCEASSNCNRTLTCSGDVCGLFRITWAYWADAGKPTLDGETADTPGAYPNCVNDPYCAAKAIQAYMTRFGQDCNGDGKVDCLDYMRIHKLGGYNCKGEIPYDYGYKFNVCMEQFLPKP